MSTQSPWFGVAATLGAYSQALDQKRLQDLADLFTPDGTSEIVGVATFMGREEIAAGYAGFASDRASRHVAGNVTIEPISERTAKATSGLVFYARDESGWGVELVGRYDDELRLDDDGTWRFTRRTTTFI